MNAKMIRERYPSGMHLQLESMSGEPQMPQGLRGVVCFVDDIGQIHVEWENGSALALNCDVDVFRIIEPEMDESLGMEM